MLRVDCTSVNDLIVSKNHAIKLIGYKLTFHVSYQFMRDYKMLQIFKKQAFQVINSVKRGLHNYGAL